jgi:hypothetical protein
VKVRRTPPLSAHGARIAQLLDPYRLSDAERTKLARPRLRIERREFARD